MTFGKTGEMCSVPGRYRCFGETCKRIEIAGGEIFPGGNIFHQEIWILIAKAGKQKTTAIITGNNNVPVFDSSIQ